MEKKRDRKAINSIKKIIKNRQHPNSSRILRYKIEKDICRYKIEENGVYFEDIHPTNKIAPIDTEGLKGEFCCFLAAINFSKALNNTSSYANSF